MIPAPGILSLESSSPPTPLGSKQWNTATLRGWCFCDCYKRGWLLSCSRLCCLFGCMFWWSKLPCWRDPYITELRAAPDKQPAKNYDPQSKSPWGNQSWQQPCELRRESFPSWAFRWPPSLSQHLWESLNQRTAKLCVYPWPTGTVRQ